MRIGVGLVLGLGAVLLGVLWLARPDRQAGLEPGQEIPPLRIELDDGRQLSIRDLRGAPWVLSFWASWCYACKEEVPLLNAAHAQLTAHGGGVIGLGADPPPLSRSADTADRWGMRFPVARADQGVLDRFGVEVLPTTYVVDRGGRIVLSRVGTVTREALDTAIETALRKRE